MKNALALLASLICIAISPADYDLGELSRAKKLNLHNRTIDPSKAGSPEVVFLDAAANDGLAWITDASLASGTLELEVKGRDLQGKSFVGIAFHGQDNQTFDCIYVRPFNFRAADPERKSHSLQYVSMPGNNWNKLRTSSPGKYECAITPPPAPEDWVKLKVAIQGKKVAVFVNGAETPALQVDLLNGRFDGNVGLWVGNGSDGWFRNLRIVKAE